MFRQIGETLSRLYDTVMPGFWLRMKPAYQWAAAIALLAIVWVASGQLMGTAKPVDPDEVKPTSGIPQVRVATLDATSRDATVTIRGRTQAKHEVDVRAEVEGVVQ